MTKILILGGSKFVGKSLAKHLIKTGYSVDILTKGSTPIDYSGYNEHIICDRNNTEALSLKLESKNYDCVFDISAYTKKDVEDFFNSIDSNEIKKYIFCSSVAVYKDTFDRVSEDFDRCENSNWNEYGLNKLEAEDFILDKIDNYNLNALIFRPTYIYGPENNLYRESYFFDRLLNCEEIAIPADDSIRAQFIYIDDLVKIFECSIYNDKVGAYNVTSPEQVTFEHLLTICKNITKSDTILKKIYPYDNIDVRSYFPFRNTNMNFTINKLRSDAFHLPVTNLEMGLKRTYEWYKEVQPKLEDKKMINIDVV